MQRLVSCFSVLAGLAICFVAAPAYAATIDLDGGSTAQVSHQSLYVDPGGVLKDDTGTELPWSDVTVTVYRQLSPGIVMLEPAGVDSSHSPGTVYEIEYAYAGVTETRTVTVIPSTYVLALIDDPGLSVVQGESWNDPGGVIIDPATNQPATLADGVTPIPWSSVVTTVSPSTVDTSAAVGTVYTITYEYLGGVTQRTVTVIPANTTNVVTQPSAPTTQVPVSQQTISPSTPGNSGGSGGLVPCTGDNECRICHLLVLTKNIIDFFVLICTIIAAILFVNAGVLYVFAPSKPGNIARAHKIFTNTLIGLVIVVATWLLLDTGIKAFYDGSKGAAAWGPWNELLCKGDNPDEFPKYLPTVAPSGPTVYTTSPTTANPGGLPVYTDAAGNTVLSDAAARSEFDSLGVSVWESRPGATSLEGMQESTVDGASELIQDAYASGTVAPGDVIITGGTESGYHAPGTLSHEAGYKIDFEDTAAMDQYIADNFTADGYRGSDPQYTTTLDSGQDVVCVEESTHWDCTFMPT